MVLRHILDYVMLPPPSLLKMDLGGDHKNQKPLMVQFFEWNSHGSEHRTWWQIFAHEVPNLSQMGFTQAWLPPPNKAMVKDGRGYDAYDLWDLGEFDQKGERGTRWGTKEQFISACSTAKAHGIGVIIDAVLNHKVGGDKIENFPAIQVDPQDRNRRVGSVREMEGWTRFEFPGRGSEYSEFTWTQEHFTGVDYDNRTKSSGIFKIIGKGHKGWSKRVDGEFGNYDFLLGCDIDHRHPDVKKDLLRWGDWILETTGSVGFRLDAVKHIDYNFLREFICNARNTKGKEGLFVVSECWCSSYTSIRKYLRILKGETSFFDVPLHETFYRAGRLGIDFDLRTVFSGTLVKYRPNDAVTFVDNHDTVIGQSLESWVESWFKPHAYALILLRKQGYPCVFYGDLYDPNIGSVVMKLIHLRQKFTYGKQIDVIHKSPLRNCIGFAHTGVDDSHPSCVVLLSNAIAKREIGLHVSSEYHTLSVHAGGRNAQKKYRDVFGYEADLPEIVTDAHGVGKFRCPFGKIAVWVESESESAGSDT